MERGRRGGGGNGSLQVNERSCLNGPGGRSGEIRSGESGSIRVENGDAASSKDQRRRKLRVPEIGTRCRPPPPSSLSKYT